MDLLLSLVRALQLHQPWNSWDFPSENGLGNGIKWVLGRKIFGIPGIFPLKMGWEMALNGCWEGTALEFLEFPFHSLRKWAGK